MRHLESGENETPTSDGAAAKKINKKEKRRRRKKEKEKEIKGEKFFSDKVQTREFFPSTEGKACNRWKQRTQKQNKRASLIHTCYLACTKNPIFCSHS